MAVLRQTAEEKELQLFPVCRFLAVEEEGVSMQLMKQDSLMHENHSVMVVLAVESHYRCESSKDSAFVEVWALASPQVAFE